MFEFNLQEVLDQAKKHQLVLESATIEEISSEHEFRGGLLITQPLLSIVKALKNAQVQLSDMGW